MTAQEAREHNRHIEPFLRGRDSKVGKSDRVRCGMPSSRYCHSPKARRLNRLSAIDRHRYKVQRAKELEQEQQERMQANVMVRKAEVKQIQQQKQGILKRVWTRLNNPIKF